MFKNVKYLYYADKYGLAGFWALYYEKQGSFFHPKPAVIWEGEQNRGELRGTENIASKAWNMNHFKGAHRDTKK